MARTLTEADIYKARREKGIVSDGIFVTFNQSVRFQAAKIGAQVRFRNCIFKGLFTIKKAIINEVLLTFCEFENGILIQDARVKNCAIVECKSKFDIDINNLEADDLKLDRVATDSQTVNVYSCIINRCKIGGLRDNSVWIISSYNKDLPGYDKEKRISALTYNADSQFKGELLVAGISMDILGIYGTNRASNLNFKDLDVHLVNIGHFTNNGNISFSTIDVVPGTSTLHCFNANLGRTEIYDVAFSKFSVVAIENSSIQDIVATNVKWCKGVKSSVAGNSTAGGLREVYRQLKNVSIRQNDKVQELIYHRYEMNALLKDLREQDRNWADRFIIWSNRISNAHGHSWRRAAGLLLLISLIVFTLNKWLLGYTHFDSNMIAKDVGLFFESINPLRKFSAIYDETKQGP